MAPPRDLTSWLQSSGSTSNKRKFATDADAASDKENAGVPPLSRKKRKTASSAAKSKPKPSGNTSKTAKAIIQDTTKDIEKKVPALNKRVKTITGRSYAVTNGDYADVARKELTGVQKLEVLDAEAACRLALYLADIAVTDLDATAKMCGCDNESQPGFVAIDSTLLPLIKKQAEEALPAKISELPTVPHRWTRGDADVGVFKTGWPNKQQRNQMYTQKLSWEKDRRERRMQRRVGCEDWVSVFLADLKENRHYLGEYGVEPYLPESIARLEELDGLRE